MAKHNNLANCSRTRKRHNKPVHSRPTLKYGGGRATDWAKRNLVPKGLAKRLGWRKSVRLSPLSQEQLTASNIKAYGQAKVRGNAKTLPPTRTTMPLPPPPPLQPIQPTLPRSESIGSIHESGSDSNIESPDGGYEDVESVKNKIAELNKSEAAKLAQQQQEAPQLTEQNSPAPENMYVSAENVRKMKAARKTAAQMSPVFKEIRARRTQTPTSNKSLTPTQLSSNHTYDVLPPREEEEIFERLPTMAQAAKRNSLKKSKSNVTAIWETATAAAKKSSSPKNRKSSLKIKPGTVGKIVANWGKN